MKEGDSNSSFFHSCVNYRRTNNILALQSGQVWVEGSANVKMQVHNYFKSLFPAQNYRHPLLDGLIFKRLTVDDNMDLITSFTMEDIKGAIWNCDGDKSPGQDGFNFNFFKKFWKSLKGEIKINALVNEFYSNSSLPKKNVYSSFVSLIPKRDNPQKITDFWPNLLLGTSTSLSRSYCSKIKASNWITNFSLAVGFCLKQPDSPSDQ